MAVFEELNALNVNGHTEKKKSGNTELTYLSWPWAWAEVKKRYEDASYTIWKDENNRPYILDPETGYMVYTSVTINGITHEMWLPVMDGANKAMRNAGYDYTVKNPNFKYAKKQPDGRFIDSYGNEQKEFITKHCEAATMMDINKTIMRCLVKNLAMFGLGLYIYAGEDLPETEQDIVADVKGPVVAQPVLKADAPAKVETVAQVPAIPKEEPKANPVQAFLLTAMAGLRKKRNITPTENNKLFAAQHEALKKAGIAPDKELKDYTMDEASGLIDAMTKCFELTGTELKVE